MKQAGLDKFDIGLSVFCDGPRLAVQAPAWELKDDETILDYQDDFKTNPIMERSRDCTFTSVSRGRS
mgnify:CR=1 FL=1